MKIIKNIVVIIIIFAVLRNLPQGLFSETGNMLAGFMPDIFTKNKMKEESLRISKEPIIMFDEIKEILELSVVEQRVEVIVDTVVPIKKEYRNVILEMVGYNSPIWTSNSEARIRLKYNFKIKAGYNLKNDFDLIISPFCDSILVYMPKPEILTIETLNFESAVSKYEYDYSIFINGKYISEAQKNSLHEFAKKTAKNKAIENEILKNTDLKGRDIIYKILKKSNQNFNIKIQ